MRTVSTPKTSIETLSQRTEQREIIAALAMLDTIYRGPELAGEDQKARAQLWFGACGHLPLSIFQRACAKHIRDSKFFPRPSEINDLAAFSLDVLTLKANDEAARQAKINGLHPDRIRPREFPQNAAVELRTNPTWYRFLDGIHPAHEHYFFADAKLGEWGHIITVSSKFARERIFHLFWDELEEAFGRAVTIHAPEPQRTTKQPKVSEPLSENEVVRRAQVCLAARKKHGWLYTTELAK